MGGVRAASGAALSGGRGLLWLAAAGCALSVAVNVASAYVRLSLAGLGCEGWPACAAGYDPGGWALDGARLVHRVAAIFAGLAAFGVVVLGFEGRARGNRVLVVLIGALVIGLALVGRASARDPSISVLLGNLLGGLALAALFALLWERNRGAPPLAAAGEGMMLLTALALAALGAQLGLGALTSATQAAADCASGECNDQALGLLLSAHGIFAGPTAMLVLAVGGALWWKARTRLFGTLVGALAVAQVALGSMMGTLGMPLALVVTHNALANLLLVALAVALTALVRARRAGATS